MAENSNLVEGDLGAIETNNGLSIIGLLISGNCVFLSIFLENASMQKLFFVR